MSKSRLNYLLKEKRPKGRSWLAICLLLSLAISPLMGAGCNHVSEERKEASEIPVKREAARGDVALTAELDRQTVQVAQPVTMKITVRAPEGVSVSFPERGPHLGSFRIVGMQDQFDVPSGEERLWKRMYQLESLSSGKKTIPSVDLSFVDRRGEKAIRGTLHSEPLSVEITSLLEGQANPREFRDIKGLVEIPEEDVAQHSWLIYGTSVGGVILVASLIILLWNRRRKSHTPAELALVELAELQRSNLLEHGDTQPFYCRLTDIVRQYIEARFGYRAPKQTTTEFLSAVQSENLLCAEHQASLQEFLQVADMVKFACHRPSHADADDAIGKAREFVLETAGESGNAVESTKEQVVA